VVRWEIVNWADVTRLGNTQAPIRFSLYRWADPSLRDFAQRYSAESRHDGFLNMDLDKSTPLPRPTVTTVDGRLAVEQTFPADPTFPEGFRYLLAPFASEAQIAPVDLSASGEARLIVLTPQQCTSGWLVVGVPTSSSPGGPQAELASVASGLAPEAAETTLKQWREATVRSATDFWSHSGISVADPIVERIWYETFHARRCTYRKGKTPPGLFLPSTVRDYSHWHGDYHSNYNYQQPFWADYTANQVDLGDSYFDGMNYFLQMGRILAERYYGTRGAFIQLTAYPILAVDDVLGAVPMGRMAYMTGWMANHYWARYACTQDKEWLAEVGYPAMRDCALFYLDFMQKGEDGLYHVFPSNQGEDGFTGDPKDYTDRTQIMRHLRFCLRITIWAAEALGVDADLREQWQERLDKCAVEDAPAPVFEGLWGYFQQHTPPEYGDGRLPRPTPPSVGGEPWPGPESWLDLWYAGQYTMIAVPNIRHGEIDPRRVYDGFARTIRRWRHPNGLVWAMSLMDYGHAGAWSETLGICAPLQEMMLQSYGKVIRLFPLWPSDVDASFRTFRAEGAFLVSAAWRGGKVADCTITSEVGGPCRVYSPWETGITVTRIDGQAVEAGEWQAGIWEFATEVGESYRVAAR